jgi:peptidoglycan/LPS O-acetylase OafA/YrhL
MNRDGASTPAFGWLTGLHCPALDGVRGVAILAVTLYRLIKELDPDSHPLVGFVRRFAPLGERGVDLFFVLSGFLITGILIRSKGKPKYFRNFIVRRSLRIFPLYFASLIVGLFVLPRVIPTQAFEFPRKEQFYLWTYLSNVRMSWLNEWCFGPMDHFWSLAVEEHFYLLWPLIVLICASKRLILVCGVTIAVVALTRTIAATSARFDVAVDVLTIFRADALSMGALLAGMLHHGASHDRLLRTAWIIATITFPLLLFAAISGKRLLGIPNTVCPLFLMAGIAVVMLSPSWSILPRLCETRFLRFLGKYSYGMYVFQLPLVTLLPVSQWTGLFPADPILQGISYVGAMFCIITVLAVLSFHLFESHFLRWKALFHA